MSFKYYSPNPGEFSLFQWVAQFNTPNRFLLLFGSFTEIQNRLVDK